MTEGLVFQRLLTPELVPDEIFRAAFGALAIKADNEQRSASVQIVDSRSLRSDWSGEAGVKTCERTSSPY
jgi:hypothetical protein